MFGFLLVLYGLFANENGNIILYCRLLCVFIAIDFTVCNTKLKVVGN